MSSSNTPQQLQYAEKDENKDMDPLSLLEEKIKELNEDTEENHLTTYKRKLSTDIGTFNQKKPKVKSNESEIITKASDCEKENQKINISSTATDSDEIIHDSELNSEEKTKEEESANENNENVATLSKINTTNEESLTDKLPPPPLLPQSEDGTTETDGTSKEKKDKNEEKRKVQNLRKNIKDVLDESQLDATTLAAQRLEYERLARLQEAQRLMRETQRQQQAEKLANKTQQKVLSLLGESNESTSSAAAAAIDLDDPLFEKLSLNPAISITPASKETLQSLQSLINADEKLPDSDDDDVIIQPENESNDKSKAVIVDSSSDSDDCIILSDVEDEEVEEDDEDDNNSGEHTNDLYNQPDSEGRVVVNIGHNEREEDIYVAPQIARVIKPHQIGGVRFLYDNIIESIELFKKSIGFGCILAHSMGLGKTLQLVCFCDIFLRHTISKTVLIIMPINTLQNWVNEFNMWIPLPEDVEKSPLTASGEVRPRNFKIYVLNDSHKSLSSRAKVVLEWQKDGGVLMMGYEMFRLLSLKKQAQKKKKKGSLPQNFDNDVPSNEDQDFFDKIYDALVDPGPDLVICDEGHRIKNASASTSIALKQIKSMRRIVLTGYPLQNNLLEYWCMVDFVRPNYLGTKTEFSNMFERPIQNGQCIDSTPQDCKLMKYRAHVLHSLLKGFVQRRSHAVLQKCLPQKTEHVLLVRLTPFQRKLYTVFMDEVVRSKKVPNPLKAFAVCCKIWNHPDVLYHFLKKRELDLEIELEEAENDRKNDNNTKKKGGRKGKESANKKNDGENSKSSDKSVDQALSNELSPIKLESSKNNIPSHSTDNFKPPVTPSSNDSAYSSNQSQSSNYENYNSYTNYYDPNNPYQNYNNYTNNNGGYQNWNGSTSTANGTNYWQNNYYQSDYYHSNSYQSYYGNQNPMQIPETKHHPTSSINQSSLPPPPPTLPATVNSQNENTNVKPIENKTNNDNNGGLLADVIQKEQQEKNKDDISDSIVLKNNTRDDGIPYDWAVELMKDYVPDLLENSPKMEIFFCILDESVKLGDRILVFSQSLLTLNHIERFLQRSKIPNTDTYWMKNQSYFRLDGSTAALEREKLINEFNANTNLKLFLVSTRAGSLGINLVGANRVVVFDASWNPCHDTQAVCRVYRYGQSKSCFVYRLVVDNCLEKKIYDRQINKQGMADRVIDECNPDAHLSMKEVTSLCYDDGEDPEIADFTEKSNEYDDLVMKKVLCNFSKALTREPFQHESLLVDRKEKKLSQAEKRLAQRGYEMEKKAATKPTYNFNPSGTTNYRLFRTPDGTLIQRPIMNNSRVAPVTDFTQNHQNSIIRADNPRPNSRWISVEQWQSKGITAQEMTLPQDVSIQTNSADKSKIFLKAGQKVIVLKSPRGICLQLESGKVIAIRASVKSGQSTNDLKTPLLPGFTDSNAKNDANATLSLPSGNSSGNKGSDDVIDMTNSDDDETGVNKILEERPMAQTVSNGNGSLLNTNINDANESRSISSGNNSSEETIFKEKPVYKPNLVQRKPKIVEPSISTIANTSSVTTTSSSMYQNDRNRGSISYGSTSNYPPQHKLAWNRYQDSASSSNYYRDLNGGSKSNHSMPYQNQNIPVAMTTTTTTAPTTRPNDSRIYSSSNSSAFHAPSSSSYQSSYMQPPSHFQSHNSYSSSSYQNSGYNYPPSNYNYYSTPSYSSAPPRNYHYPQYGSGGYGSYADYNNQYGTNQIISSNYANASSTYVPTATTATESSTSPTSSTSQAASNYSQWNWNK